VELLERQIEDIFLVAKHAGTHEALSFFQQALLVDEVAADHAVLRRLPLSDEGPYPVDHAFGHLGLVLPVGQAPQTLQHLLFLIPGLLPPSLEAPFALAALKVLELPRMMGKSAVGRSLQRGLIVDLADAAHAVFVEEGADGVPCFLTARELRKLVQKIVVLDMLQKTHHLGIRADYVRDVQKCESHLRRHVVGNRLRERVSRILLAEPIVQLLIQRGGG
jgi:hypothetical protein